MFLVENVSKYQGHDFKNAHMQAACVVHERERQFSLKERRISEIQVATANDTSVCTLPSLSLRRVSFWLVCTIAWVSG